MMFPPIKQESIKQESPSPPPPPTSPASTDAMDLEYGIRKFTVLFKIEGERTRRVEVAADTTFEDFCGLLQSLYGQGGEMIESEEFEYVLVEKRFHRNEVVGVLWDGAEYRKMVRTIMKVQSHWRHAVVGRRDLGKFTCAFGKVALLMLK